MSMEQETLMHRNEKTVKFIKIDSKKFTQQIKNR